MHRNLIREIGNQHMLFGIVHKLVVLAADGASDDILAGLTGDQDRFFIIHPTHSAVLENDPRFPWCFEVEKGVIPSAFFGNRLAELG